MRLKFLLVFLLISSAVWSQSAGIRGKLTFLDGNPAADIHVFLKPAEKSTTTSSNGTFEFDGLSAGKYQLVISGVKVRSIKKSVSVKAEETAQVQYKVEEAVKELQTVEITGRLEDSYKNDISFVGSKMATPIREVPQSISYVTKELLLDQGAYELGDAVKNMSGVNQFTFYDDLSIRGHRMNGGGTTQLFNGLRTFSGFWKQPPVNYLERVEVIKGAASVLYGNTSPGGTVNRVTKKPLTTPRKFVSFTTGSFNTLRALADFTGPMNEQKTLLYRLNMGYVDAQSFRNLQFDNNILLAPSISFLPTKKTRINFDMVYNRNKGMLDRGQSVKGDSLYSGSIRTSLNAVNDHLITENYLITTSLTHQFNQNTSFNLSYLRTGVYEDLQEHRSSNVNAVDSLGEPIENLVGRQVFIRQTKQFMDNVSIFANHNFTLGKTEHRLVAGYDFIQASTPNGSGQITASGYLLKDGGAAPYDPENPERFIFYDYTENGETRRIPKPNVSSYDLTVQNNVLEDVTKYVFNDVRNARTPPTLYRLHGIYLQEQMKFNRLFLLLGLRYDTYIDKLNYARGNEENVVQHALLPRVGAVFVLTKNINIYGTYTTGYNPQSPAIQNNPLTGGPFDPVESNLIEGGLKTEWLNGILTANASYYKINQFNTLYPADEPENPDLMLQIGKESAEGFEFDVTGNLTPNWNVVLTYSRNGARITEVGSDEDDQVLLGRQKPNAPKHQGSFWTKYSFANVGIEGLGIGLGGNFVAERTISLSNAQTLPAYVLFNAALYYKVDKFQFQVNLKNITNRTHWVGGYDYLRLFPGAPRNFLATVSYSF